MPIRDAGEVPSPQLSDEALIREVRGGSSTAYGLLYERHADSALATACRYAGNLSDAGDLVSEAFANVLQVLQSGKGPDVFFRAYLLTTLRRLAAAKRSADEKLFVLDDLERVAPVVPATNAHIEAFESETVARSFGNLPERWQQVLWHTEIDGLAPAAVAPILGMSANAVSALAVRAREGLKQAYLQNHLSGTASPSCAAYAGQLGAYARNGLTLRRAKKCRAHVDDCLKCTEKLLYLEDVGVGMRALVFPAILGLSFTGKGAAVLGVGLGAGLGTGSSTSGAATTASTSSVTGGVASAGTAAAGLGLPAMGVFVAGSVVVVALVGAVVAAAVGLPLFGGQAEESSVAAPGNNAAGEALTELPAPSTTVPASEPVSSSSSRATEEPRHSPTHTMIPSLPIFMDSMVPEVSTKAESQNSTVSATTGPSETVEVQPTQVPTSTLISTDVPVPSPTSAPSDVPTPTVSVTPSLGPSPSPSVMPTAGPSPSPSVTPTVEPSPTPLPSVTPSVEPSPSPSVTPSVEPSPTAEPTEEPTPPPPTEVPPVQQGQFLASSSELEPVGGKSRLQVVLLRSEEVQLVNHQLIFSTSSWLIPTTAAVEAPPGWVCEKSLNLGFDGWGPRWDTQWTCTADSWSGETAAFVLTRSQRAAAVSLDMSVKAEDTEDFTTRFTF